jgi:iron complex transport system substrate-binding protein
VLLGTPACVDRSEPPTSSARDVRRHALPDGGELVLAGSPQHIVPAAAGSVDLLCELVPPERIAALPDQALRYSGLRDPGDPHLARPRFDAYEAEPLLAAEPDLVIAHGWQRGETTARLREAGVPVLVLGDPTSWAETRDVITLLGRILDAEDAAADLVARYDERVDALAARRALRGARPTALAYSNGGAGGWVAGADTTCHEFMELAGLDNLAARDGQTGHRTITYEELLLLDPDVFVVSGAADAQSPGGTAALLRNEPALASLRAVAADRILVLEPWLYTSVSQHVVDAAEQLADSLDALPAAR